MTEYRSVVRQVLTLRVDRTGILGDMAHRFAFLDHPGALAFAHRGGAFDGLENSMAAFDRAVRLGYRYLETDVRATADGALLAFHDDTLDRVTDRTGRISTLPYAEVARARIGGREPIPLVEDVLGSWPDVRLNIDVKDLGCIQPLVRTLRRTGAADRVCVASFSDRRLTRVRRLLGPAVCTSFGPWEALTLRLASYGGLFTRLARNGVPCAQLPVSVAGFPVMTPAFVRTAHELGVDVHAWTVNDAAEMRRLLDIGVDGIMTDRLETLREVLMERDAWPSP